MRRSFLILALIAGSLIAQEPGTREITSLRDAALEHLLSERGSAESFKAAVADARKHGVNEQAILEARFLFHVDRHEDDAIAAMLPDFLARQDSFKLDESEIFGVTEDWLAVTEYVRAIAALKKDDKEAFKKHITEAFWLSPRQGAAFAPHIDRLRLAEAMAAVKIDFPRVALRPLAGGDAITLESMVKGKKALLLHFWSPWSRECEASMPDFSATAKELLARDFAVISILPENSTKVLDDARAMLGEIEGTPRGEWLVDREKLPLSRDLRVQSVPVMVLVSKDGRVLFNGHPTDDELWEKLKELDPGASRPALTDGAAEP